MIMAKSMTDVSINLAIVFLITSVVLTFDTIVVFCSGNNSSHHVVCVENERRALLKFKQDLSDPSNRLFSWVADQSGGNCCEWVGVVCNNLTGNVQELHLQNPFLDAIFNVQYLSNDEYEAFEASILGGKLNPSLQDLKHLTYLDLSGNNFNGIQIPSFIGSFGSLRYLNLSFAGFGGVIPTQLENLSGLHFLDLWGGFEGVFPHQLGNLSNLHSLDLRGDFEGVIPHQLGNLSNLHHLRLEGWGNLYAHTLQWISGSSLLQHLDLEYVNLSKAHEINMLPSLVELHLVYCGIHHFPPLHILNFTSLAVLDLSENPFESFIPPDWLLSLHGLDHLGLRSCGLHISIPSGLRNITFLRYLDLSYNLFNSTTPD
ncbi:receptor-like protein EIX2 [Cornus florida]|uniref:receptor-like protein EIX2 n=1 Tax=Cornus florida TaxID=4283 RepID=UPI0028A19511|nr:receptor-like protein EIX2 [Cornus florida]